jgi:iron complex transport system substrate-binding protein
LPKEYRVYGTEQQLGGILYGDLGLQASENVKAIGKAEPISIETLPDFDADYIFVQVGFPVIGGDSDAEKNFVKMMESSLWKNLEAVKNNRVFIVPYWTLRDFPIINEKTLDIVSQHILAS